MNLSCDLFDWTLKGHARQRIALYFGREADVADPIGVELRSIERASAAFREAILAGEIRSLKAVEVHHGNFIWVLNPIRGILVTVRSLEREAGRADDYALWKRARLERREHAQQPGASKAHDRDLARRVRRWHVPEGNDRRTPRYRRDE